MNECYLNIKDVPGNSIKARHLGETEVETFMFSIQGAKGGMGTSAHLAAEKFFFEIRDSSSSAIHLMALHMKGTLIPEVNVSIDVINPRGEFLYFHGYTFSNCIFSSMSMDKRRAHIIEFNVIFEGYKIRRNWVEE